MHGQAPPSRGAWATELSWRLPENLPTPVTGRRAPPRVSAVTNAANGEADRLCVASAVTTAEALMVARLHGQPS